MASPMPRPAPVMAMTRPIRRSSGLAADRRLGPGLGHEPEQERDGDEHDLADEILGLLLDQREAREAGDDERRQRPERHPERPRLVALGDPAPQRRQTDEEIDRGD